MQKNKVVFRFLFSALILYILWFLVYELWLHPKEFIDLFVIKNSVSFSKLFLELFGYDIRIIEIRRIIINSVAGVMIGDPCNGINLFALFTGFIIAFPGNLKSKFVMIPIGIVVIHILNIFRISGLLLLQLYSPQYLEFNHTYTFTAIVYMAIFFLWMYWIKRYGLKLNTSNGSN